MALTDLVMIMILILILIINFIIVIANTLRKKGLNLVFIGSGQQPVA